MSENIYIEDIAISCALGHRHHDILTNLTQGRSPGLQPWSQTLFSGRGAYVGRLTHQLDDIDITVNPDNRNNRLAQFLCKDLEPSITRLHQRYRAQRIGVIIGSSTSGIEATEQHIAHEVAHGALPKDFSHRHQDMGDVARVIAKLTGAEGPVYTVSTACTSSSRALISASKLISAGLCDAVICGGVDTLCHLTVNGFDSLEQVSDKPCRPFDADREGINVAEGGALLIVTAEKSDIGLAGYGESSDAHHLSSPMPCGSGARRAMEMALESADLDAHQVDYINAHGTSTEQNDAMESRAIADLFGLKVAVSSTKALTGHCLGAAGAVEAALSCLILRHKEFPLPPQWPTERVIDNNMAPINVITEACCCEPQVVMSNSFAFGGNNAVLVFVKDN
ncbi:beta-ketoacyl-ACP synthase [Vibrio astriarenae]